MNVITEGRKLHCYKGHAYTPENTSHNGNGGRICKTCRRNRDRDKRYRLQRGLEPLQPSHATSMTDEQAFKLQAVHSNQEFLSRLYAYGARNGGLPNIPAIACFALLRRVA